MLRAGPRPGRRDGVRGPARARARRGPAVARATALVPVADGTEEMEAVIIGEAPPAPFAGRYFRR